MSNIDIGHATSLHSLANGNINAIGSIRAESFLSLSRLVDLALCSAPNVGVVNFNLLKIFLLELLKALNVQNHELRLDENDQNAKSLIEEAISTSELKAEDHGSDIGEKTSDEKQQKQSQSLLPHGQEAEGTVRIDLRKPISSERMHALEDKLGRLEQQVAAWNALPSNEQIVEKSKELLKKGKQATNSITSYGSTNNTNPILEVWQYTQLSKRLESNEEGITKLTSLLQELIGDISDLKESQVKNAADLNKLNTSYKDLLDKINGFEKDLKGMLPLMDDLKKLENQIELLSKNMVLCLLTKFKIYFYLKI
jgi:hypothetical protein